MLLIRGLARMQRVARNGLLIDACMKRDGRNKDYGFDNNDGALSESGL